MATTITSFISVYGIPQTALLPTINVWEVATGTLVVSSASMSELSDGFYKYTFAAYNELLDYVVRVDAGVSIPADSRYYVTELTTGGVVLDSSDIQNIVDGVWDEPAANHIVADTMGEFINKIQTDTAQCLLGSISVLAMVEELLKYDTNRTKIDKVAKTLTIYDNNGITPLKVFELKDSVGTLSIDEVYERSPI